MERNDFNAPFPGGHGNHAKEGNKSADKLNILGMEIIRDDSPLAGAASRIGISGKTLIEQMTRQPAVWAVGGGEGMTGGGTGGSEDNHAGTSGGQEGANADLYDGEGTGTASAGDDAPLPGTPGSGSGAGQDDDEKPHVET